MPGPGQWQWQMDGSWCCATDPSACRSLTNLQLRFGCLPLNRHRSLDKCGFLKIGCPHFRKSPNVNRSTRQRPQHPQHNSGITAGPDLELLMRDQASEWCMASAVAPKLNKKPVEPVEPDKLERNKQQKNEKEEKTQCKSMQARSINIPSDTEQKSAECVRARPGS